MKYKIEKLDDSSVVYMRMIGTYQSDKNFEMMKTLSIGFRLIIIGNMLRNTVC